MGASFGGLRFYGVMLPGASAELKIDIYRDRERPSRAVGCHRFEGVPFLPTTAWLKNIRYLPNLADRPECRRNALDSSA